MTMTVKDRRCCENPFSHPLGPESFPEKDGIGILARRGTRWESRPGRRCGAPAVNLRRLVSRNHSSPPVEEIR